MSTVPHLTIVSRVVNVTHPSGGHSRRDLQLVPEPGGGGGGDAGAGMTIHGLYDIVLETHTKSALQLGSHLSLTLCQEMCTRKGTPTQRDELQGVCTACTADKGTMEHGPDLFEYNLMQWGFCLGVLKSSSPTGESVSGLPDLPEDTKTDETKKKKDGSGGGDGVETVVVALSGLNVYLRFKVGCVHPLLKEMQRNGRDVFLLVRDFRKP